MAQFGRPDADVTVNDWVATPLFEKINEATRDDGDLISSGDNTSNLCEVGLSNLTDPASSSGHVVRYTYRKNAAGGNARDITVALIQGTTEIASWTHTGISETFTQAAQTLSGAQADAITDYTDLRLRFTPGGATGGPPGGRRSVETSWAELEVPDAVLNITGAGNIATAEAFGSPQINQSLAGAGAIGSAEAFGSAQLDQNVTAAGAIATAEAHGTPQVKQEIRPSGIASAEAFGSPTVDSGVQTISPSGIASAEAHGTAVVAGPVSPSGIATAEAFGSPQVNLQIAPSAIPSAEAHGAAQLNLTIFPSSLVDPSGVGNPTLLKYKSAGLPFLYTSANWSGLGLRLEAYLRATAGTARARLWNVSDGAPVAGSELTTTSAVFVRLRTGALTLEDGKEYRVQFGAIEGSTGEALGGKLVAF